MPQLTESQALDIAKKVVDDLKLGYDPDEGFQARFNEAEKLRTGERIPVWTVSYVTPKGFLDQVDHFIYIDDSTGEYLYIITPTTYIE